jgi:phosphate transport system substrate-binding protein
MVPVLQELARVYNESHSEVTIEVNGGGSAEGIKSLEQGKATIAAVARPATEEERRRARLIRRTDLVGIPIAMDAVIFFVRPDNPLDSLTLDQVRDIFMHRVTMWEQVDVPIEGRINVHLPAEGSGPLGVVQLRVLKGKAFTTVKTEYESGREVVSGVANDPLGIGLSHIGHTVGVKVMTLKKEVSAPSVAATSKTVQSRTYPLAHYLYLYFIGQPQGQAKDFLVFVIGPEGQSIIRRSEIEQGAVPRQVVPLPLHSARD